MTTARITDMSAAADIIRRGGLVAVPTETVYGLAANGLDGAAVLKIYQVKNRPEIKPLSLLVSGMADVEVFCRCIPESACRLAAAFWPGPLTMILKKRANVPDIVTAGGDTVGVRCPDHPQTLAIIRLAGTPLAAPSANMSGAPGPVSAEQVLAAFDGRIDAVVDGGVCSLGRESTIVDLTCVPPRLVRPGALPAMAVEDVLQTALAR